MEAIKNISLGIIYGLWDSIRGIGLLWHIDAEINRINEEKEAERRRRKREREQRRNPSPTPSSAAAMAREELKELIQQRDIPDERSINSIFKRSDNNELTSKKPEKRIAKQVLKCCLLNGGFAWLSIVLFDQFVLPIVKFAISLFFSDDPSNFKYLWSYLQPVLSVIFGMTWLLPIFLLSKFVSSLWFAEIANSAYRIRKGKPQLIPNFSKLLADFLFNFLVQVLFLIQSMLVNLLPVPYIGEILCFIHLSLLYSLYCFEYKWFNMGWELHRRLNYIENNWPYFLGFGIPLTVLTNMTNSIIVSSCIFSIFFPLFILSGNEAIPIVDAANFSMRLFSPVIFTSNLIFTRGGPPKLNADKLVQQKKQLLIQQGKQLEEHNLIQQHIENEYLGRSRSRQTDEMPDESYNLQRQHSSRNSHSPSASSSQYRYQQPPNQPRVPSAMRTINAFPERAPFANTVPTITPTHILPRAASTTSSSQHSTQTVRRR
ncbi:etoposide-induced protein 2.4 homolog [Bactrocera neohumeralis]|uniref:etoposide-induced protein 2.4 homolog n=1 Tax=Bactrocera neohumeralis TaxID=98809 RepID=UPI002165B1B3|nr:etoposide-induced protein 2.4 homolog [Bactrocera neohumeralis]